MPIVENEVLDRIAYNFCHSMSDSSSTLLKKRSQPHSASLSKEHIFDREPAVPGEQVSEGDV